ncbi:MAG: MotA/TolQ/ExbB proton channel family protein [Desulfuromonadales bacterium]|nr:MotA/TolQ/ExbB proton channel family protein [Desulfuromonadales bacterium]MDT8422975.1 MotA/TolQ/ExbB proton channel family protein [Desulfuromonadales bacterium]
MWEIVLKGGPLMWPILFCSVLSLALFFERLWFYYRFRRDDTTLAAEVEGLARDGRINDAEVVCRRVGSPLSRIYLAALRCAGQERARIKTVVEEIGSRELAPLERYLGLMGTIAALTPLLGLLGTVLGMIRAFNVIATAGVGTPATLGGGISEALITTASGLAVAIPTLLLHKYLSSRADRLALEVEVRSLHLVDLLEK